MSENLRLILGNISKWGKFVGWVMIVFGAISAIFGLFAFVIGAIPGVLNIIMGLFILNSAKSAGRLVANGADQQELEVLLDNYKKYLFLQGILLIVALASMIIIPLTMGGLIFSMLGNM